MFKWVRTVYVEYKPVILLSVVIIQYSIINHLEKYILKNIALISRCPKYRGHDPGNYSCPYNTLAHEDSGFNSQDTSFYWSKQQKESVEILRTFSPACTLLFAGVCSDKFGAHRVMLVGLIFGASIMSMSYLSMFNNNYIFILMLALRRSSEGMIWAALFSLAGKLALHDQRTIFISVLLTGYDLGDFLGYVISKVISKWKTVSQFCASLGFVTVIWWWMVCRKTQIFIKVRKSVNIPWKGMMTSVSLYVICLLIISCYIHRRLAAFEYDYYIKQALSFKPNHELLIRFIFCFTNMFSRLFCGFSSDYIISKRYLSTSVVRRSFISVSLVILFCTLLVIKLAKCSQLVAIGCSVFLHFTKSINHTTAWATILDLAPFCSGTVSGLVVTFPLILIYLITSISLNIFVGGGNKGDINKWNELFFALAFIILVLSLPFIFHEIKESSLNFKVPPHRNKKHVEIEIPSETTNVNQQQPPQYSVAGPSNQ